MEPNSLVIFTQVLGLALAANGRLLEALPVFREALQVTRRRAVFSDDKLDRFLARRLNDRAIFAARQAVFTCCDLLGRGAAASLDAGGSAAEAASRVTMAPIVWLASAAPSVARR